MIARFQQDFAGILDPEADLARQIVWEAAEKTFHGDRTGRRAEAVLAGAASDGPKDWLEWGGTYQVRMRVAEAQEDDAAFDRAAVARFEGTLRNFDKKQFVVELDDKQTLIFRRTKSTQIQPKDMELGVQVQVYARKDAAGDMEAVQVCQGKCSVKSR